MKTLLLRAAAFAIAAGAALGCTGGRRTGGTVQGPTSAAPDLAEEGVLLRYKFEKDRLLRYDMTFRMNSQGEGRVEDRLRAVVYRQCLGPIDDNPSPKFHKVSIVRREIERSRTERNAEGQEMPPISAVRTTEPEVSLSPGFDSAANKYYFPTDERGMIGFRPDRPFHRLVYDSIVYLLPVLPPAKVKPGGTWSVEVPVYAGADYYYPAGGFRRGNEFNLRMDGRVERVFRQAGQACAQISWECSGVFDTGMAGDRYPAGFHNRQRIIHEVKGNGKAVFDLDAGILVSQGGQATITFTSRILISKRDRDNKPAGHEWVETLDRHTVSYDCRLMADEEADPRPSGRR